MWRARSLRTVWAHSLNDTREKLTDPSDCTSSGGFPSGGGGGRGGSGGGQTCYVCFEFILVQVFC